MPFTDSILRPDHTSALGAWRRLVAADAEQVRRLREDTPGSDHYAAPSAAFRPVTDRVPPDAAAVAALVRPGEHWMDIGAGGGRFARHLLNAGARVTAIEPSAGMRGVLQDSLGHEAGLTILDARWPLDDPLRVDVAFAAHVTYDVADIDVFLNAMERSARRCVLALNDRGRGATLEPVWHAVHGEPMALLPAAQETMSLLGAMGRRYDVTTVPSAPPQPQSLDDAMANVRRLLWLAPGSRKDQRATEFVQRYWGQPDGSVLLPGFGRWSVVISWDSPLAPPA